MSDQQLMVRKRLQISMSVGLPTDRRPYEQNAAETWFQENEPKGVAFEHEVLE